MCALTSQCCLHLNGEDTIFFLSFTLHVPKISHTSSTSHPPPPPGKLLTSDDPADVLAKLSLGNGQT